MSREDRVADHAARAVAGLFVVPTAHSALISHTPRPTRARPRAAPYGGAAARNPIRPPTVMATLMGSGKTRARRLASPNSAHPKANRTKLEKYPITQMVVFSRSSRPGTTSISHGTA